MGELRPVAARDGFWRIPFTGMGAADYGFVLVFILLPGNAGDAAAASAHGAPDGKTGSAVPDGRVLWRKRAVATACALCAGTRSAVVF